MCVMCSIYGRNIHETPNDPHANESHMDKLIRMKAYHETRLAAIDRLIDLMATTPEIKVFLELEESLHKQD